jgi:hypothetical protein
MGRSAGHSVRPWSGESPAVLTSLMETAMRLFLMFLACQVTLASGQVTPPVDAQARTNGNAVTDQLVGAWRLLSVETVRSNGEIIYPIYGRHPEGLIVYDRAGWMSVQIISDPPPAVPATDSRQAFLDAPPAQKLAAVDGFYAYYGTWTVDASGATVTHHIRQSLLPGERGEEAVRQISIEGNKLTLIAKTHEMGEDHQRRLTWERLASTPH